MQRILVIDDDDLSRELLTMLLEADGYTVESACSGDEALAHPTTTDLILTDMQMPGLCGNLLAERLRTLYPTAPLIAMSGSEVPPADRALYDGFLLKPFAIADLEALLANQAIASEAQADVVLDEATYTRLHAAMSPEQVTDMFAFCLADAEKRLTRMAQAVQEWDDATYRREAHTIKGGCGMLGALELRELAGRMELEGIAGHFSEKSNLCDAFVAASRRLQRILVAHPL